MPETFEPDIYFEKLSSLIKEFNTNYSKIIIQVILEKDEYLIEPKRFFYTLIHKMNSSLDAANIFVRNFDSKPNYHPALFIILRSVLNDIILAEYIISNTSNDNEKKQLINRIYFDHIDNVIKSCEKTLPILHNWNIAEKEKKINDLKEHKKKYFDKDGKALLKPFPTSPNLIIRKIFADKIKTENSDLLKIAYDLYSVFSKFEHFGELSFDLTHKGYDEDSQEDLRSELHYCIRIVIASLRNYSRVWEDDIDIHLDYFYKLETEITNLLPD